MEERLPDWPPVDLERIGEARARAYVDWMREHIAPVIDRAKADLRRQYGDDVVLTTESMSVDTLAATVYNRMGPHFIIGSVKADMGKARPAEIFVVIQPDGTIDLMPVWLPFTEANLMDNLLASLAEQQAHSTDQDRDSE